MRFYSLFWSIGWQSHKWILKIFVDVLSSNLVLAFWFSAPYFGLTDGLFELYCPKVFAQFIAANSESFESSSANLPYFECLLNCFERLETPFYFSFLQMSCHFHRNLHRSLQCYRWIFWDWEALSLYWSAPLLIDQGHPIRHLESCSLLNLPPLLLLGTVERTCSFVCASELDSGLDYFEFGTHTKSSMFMFRYYL